MIGINFSDDLARGVVVVGLPYPDRRDPILSMKLEYMGRLRHVSDNTEHSNTMNSTNGIVALNSATPSCVLGNTSASTSIANDLYQGMYVITLMNALEMSSLIINYLYIYYLVPWLM